MPLSHEAIADINAISAAAGDGALIAISIENFALDRMARDHAAKRPGSGQTAGREASFALAHLVSLERVDAVEANTLSVDAKRVAIDRICDTGNHRRSGARRCFGFRRHIDNQA